MRWTNFQGKTVHIEEIDDQHLSNSYWYNKIFLSNAENEKAILSELLRRNISNPFYRPHVDFYLEIRGLRSLNMIIEREGGFMDIVYKGNKIGEVSREIRGEILGNDLNICE